MGGRGSDAQEGERECWPVQSDPIGELLKAQMAEKIDTGSDRCVRARRAPQFIL